MLMEMMLLEMVVFGAGSALGPQPIIGARRQLRMWYARAEKGSREICKDSHSTRRSYREVMDDIRRRQVARGHQRSTEAEIEEHLWQERDGWEQPCLLKSSEEVHSNA
jgi:hypothetical protein